MKLHDIDVKIEDEDLAIIQLAFLPLSYDNFWSSLSIGKDSIILEEVKSRVSSREFQLKAFGNGDEAPTSRLSMIDSARGQKKKKGKGSKKSKIEPKDIYNYCKELDHWKKNCPKKAKKDFVVVVVQNDSLLEKDLVLAIGEQPQQHSKQWEMTKEVIYCHNSTAPRLHFSFSSSSSWLSLIFLY